ncbi:TIGR02530 family flagellar biosynthesis protein [Alkalicoccus urumqiensis]|uniref:Flagellar protein n=1 Tax=Alkalicoccus urumqiensis TaxID=1548213 RepID=A0A2P6MG02_ALKUR|nr:TIGR02530 family flagellar biosynthesis protein [Alkalicoccus urumqiensis]PRO65225.1 flagellar protein [Alkalicoccus urumqiensis]
MSMKIQPHHFQPALKPPQTQQAESKNTNSSFKTLLQEKSEESLKISRHAEKRMEERNIHVPEKTWEAIQSKVSEAEKKGVKDSLVLTSEAAFVISAQNKTVITAMHRQEADDQLFTNINGAIIVN